MSGLCLLLVICAFALSLYSLLFFPSSFVVIKSKSRVTMNKFLFNYILQVLFYVCVCLYVIA